MVCSRSMRCHTVHPRLGEFLGVMRPRGLRSLPGAGYALRLFGSLAPPGCPLFALVFGRSRSLKNLGYIGGWERCERAQ
jgi:hypothetical protein